METGYFGFKKKAWNQAIKEIEEILVTVAKHQNQIFYSALADKVSSVSFQEPYHDLAEAIGEVSITHHDEGRPMLSVLVVHKEDQMCGAGFFKLAKELGHRFTDNLSFQVEETKKCYRYWSKHNLNLP